MSIKRVLYMLVVMLFISGLPSSNVFAETRSIYVGDIISLEIEANNLYEDELQEKFQDFEIIELKRTETGYLLSLRTFDVGERKILIGNKEIVINVASTLDDIQGDGIFEGNTDVLEAGFYFHWRIIFYLAVGVFLISLIAVISKRLIKRKHKTEPPYEKFIRCAKGLSADNYNYLVDLTFYFKEYIEKTKNCRIIGKTSSEIVNELKALSFLDALLPDIREWLLECDRLKFAHIDASNDEKRRHYERLLTIVEKIKANEGMT